MIKAAIVEDQEILRKSLKIVIESISDIEIIGTAENGEKAIALCERENIDILLMDIQMPVMDGVKATEEIKKRWPNIKIIILTTFQDVTHVLNALNAGAEGYILKAVDPEFLVQGIKMVYHGGSLIPQQLAKEVFGQIQSTKNEHSKQLDHNSMKNPYELNNQELKVLKCLTQRLSNKDISEKMFLSVGTVKNYVSNIYSKLNVKNRSSAIMKAIEESLIEDKKY
ncbi:response regulator transcription factor [Viridibacillus sp. FSL R5-0477]|uniref:LuxR family two component transcriptional regulator n=1 Tax=Viridibacillus arenosi FSL R5-213 TaxID=1227360 RepID=W4EQW3_9BACL|nr:MULTISPECIES: response regulator transcription factor [Viridibacillus]ETT82206.1 LuxR family two component transcriptional regulator [Viridibacillus arenosi FSL R5-213]OMC83712.1 DNA-binding response regulator [Viridibacillus sp. FSL H7-0596]OMC85215.1 DNA-binding response regulator [Viridibacillus sp. FSL H8-0123]OMC92681.1 DNA-binding response regulator [Viridibacillus arenosi]